MALVMLLLGACGHPGNDQAESNTPRITTSSDDPADLELLLTKEDIASIGDLGAITVKDLGDLPVYENPDPRGPCGAKVSQPALTGSVGRSFTGDSILVVELVAASSRAEEAFLAAMQADTGTPCGPYDSTTNTGSTQHVSDIAVADLDQLGAPAVGWVSRIENDGQTQDAAAGFAITHGKVVVLQVFAGDAIPTEVVQALLTSAVNRLRG